jgi:gamma-glutamyltranspeptidase / glutathione hydrolase
MLLDGKAPLPGQVMRFPNLAKTFRALAEHGKDGFYKGRIAEAIVEVIKSKGGVMELEDLARHASEFVEPIRYTYGGEVTIYEVTQAPLCTRPPTLKEHLLVPSEWTR